MKVVTRLFLVLIVFKSYSGVNLKNGNFFISYTDVIVSSDNGALEITRTYNSKSTDNGWFGFGWGSKFETSLKVSADGSIIVQENGAGALTRFSPNSGVNVKLAAEKIVKAMGKGAPEGGSRKKLVARLAGDAELRYSYAKQFNVAAQVQDGAKFRSTQRGLQELTKTKDGFVRSFNNGDSEFFNQKGRLAKIKRKSGYTINLVPGERASDKEIKVIKDSLGNQIFLSWDSQGRVKKVSAAGGQASYTYAGKALDTSTDLVGNKYDYDYDTNFNLTKIKYKDGKSSTIAYEGKSQLVASVTKKDGETISYKHGSNPQNPEFHYWTEVTKKGFDGKPQKNRYEYEIRTKPNGQQYNYRIVKTINGLKTETVYAESGQPVKISRGKSVTQFEYNKDGMLTKKILPSGKQVALDYHKKCRKVAKVIEGKVWTSFKYNKQCNLERATNSSGKIVFLVYDHKSRITRMIDKEKKSKKQKVLNFTYNALGKPTEIRIDKVGKINVSYDDYGGIKKVESKQGHKMALRVTQAFQNLLSIVRPAGVSLSAN